MALPTTKDLTKYVVDQFKGNFLGFIVGTLAARLVSTFFETRKMSNLWGLTSKKTIVSRDTFHFLEWSSALVVGFIAFVVVNHLVKEKLMSALETSTPRIYKSFKGLAASEKNDSEAIRRRENPE